MATWTDVRRLAMALPETSEGTSYGSRSWKVKGKLFVWERPLRKSDLEALRAKAPKGPILGARVGDLGEKEALLATAPRVFFTTPHFDGYPAILARLDRITVAQLKRLVTEAWRVQAPRRLVKSQG